MKLPSDSAGGRWTVEERARRYLAKCPPAISGQNGHDQLFEMACRLVHGFGISVERSVQIILCDYNPRCQPPWTEAEIRHKCVDAGKANNHKKPKKYLAGDDDTPPWEKAEEDTKKPDPENQIFVDGSAVLVDSLLRVDKRDGEILLGCGESLEGFELGPGKVTVVGAPPGTGKTSLAMQAGFAAVGNHGGLSLMVANAEMEPRVLVNRELSSRSGVSYQKIRFCEYDEHEKDRIYEAAGSLRPLMNRTQLMKPPFTSSRLIKGLEGGGGGLVIVDYLQKFRTGSDALEGIEVVMGHLRHIASAGYAVLALSSTARQTGNKKGKHDTSSLDMGAFRGSGEIEFQADAAYVLRDLSGGADGDREMLLDCVKNRHGPRKSLELTFRVGQMRFEGKGPEPYQEFEDWNDDTPF